MVIVLRAMGGVISMSPHQVHEWTGQNQQPWQNAEQGCPLEEICENEKHEQCDENDVEPRDAVA